MRACDRSSVSPRSWGTYLVSSDFGPRRLHEAGRRHAVEALPLCDHHLALAEAHPTNAEVVRPVLWPVRNLSCRIAALRAGLRTVAAIHANLVDPWGSTWRGEGKKKEFV